MSSARLPEHLAQEPLGALHRARHAAALAHLAGELDDQLLDHRAR